MDYSIDNLEVVMATIPQRRESRQVTLRQLDALGFLTNVVEQDEDLPLGSHSSTLTAQAAIRSGLHNTSATHILFVEDDIDIDPEVIDHLPALMETERVVSLWHRPRFVPRKLRTPKETGIELCRAIDLKNWFSTLAILMPRFVAQRFVLTLPEQREGTDLLLKRLLLGMDMPLWLTLPSLVEHREGKRYATKASFYVGSDDYRGPRS